jgi:putative multiple sugar transport system permease protein
MVFFQFTTGGVLFKPVNMTNLILQNSYIVIMALGMLLIIVGGPHRSVGRVSVGLRWRSVAAIMMVTVEDGSLPVTSWRLAWLLGAASLAACRGIFVAYHKIPAFIVTLAGMLVFQRPDSISLLGEPLRSARSRRRSRQPVGRLHPGLS